MNLPYEQDAKQKPKVANAIGDEGFFAGISGGGLFKPMANEQITGDAHEFPENKQQQKIGGQHDADHRK